MVVVSNACVINRVGIVLSFAVNPLQGNRLASEGLQILSMSLMANTSLKELTLCDNGIGISASPGVNRDALSALGDVLTSERASLCRVRLHGWCTWCWCGYPGGSTALSACLRCRML